MNNEIKRKNIDNPFEMKKIHISFRCQSKFPFHALPYLVVRFAPHVRAVRVLGKPRAERQRQVGLEEADHAVDKRRGHGDHEPEQEAARKHRNVACDDRFDEKTIKTGNTDRYPCSHDKEGRVAVQEQSLYLGLGLDWFGDGG